MVQSGVGEGRRGVGVEEAERYERRQLDYETGLEMVEAIREKE